MINPSTTLSDLPPGKRLRKVKDKDLEAACAQSLNNITAFMVRACEENNIVPKPDQLAYMDALKNTVKEKK